MSWLSILPPIVVFALGFWTRRIQLSLFLGIITAALIATDGAFSKASTLVIGSFWSNLNIDKLTTTAASNLFILIFVLSLGILVEMIRHCRAADAFIRFSERRIQNRRAAETSTLLLAHCLCIDDYLSSLTVGSVMKPLADRFGVARAKLALLTDSMAAPVAMITPVSSWAAAIITFLMDNGVHSEVSHSTLLIANPYHIYLQVLPYILYSLTLIATIWLVVRCRWVFGPMRHLEAEARPSQVTVEDEGRSCLLDFIVPMGTLLATTLLFLLHFGGWPYSHSIIEALQQAPISFVLFLSGLVTLAVTTGYYLWRGLLAGALAAVAWRGLRLMFPVCVILLYSWTLGSLLREELHVGQWLASLLSGSISLNLMPLLLFWNGALISLALGSSWATAAILVPIALPMVMAMDGITAPALPEQLPILCPMMGAILSGAVCGDHISLISETTAMAATSTGCGHMEHVKTQAPYALPIVIGASAGFLVVGYIGGGALASLVVSIAVSGACSCAAHHLSRYRAVPAMEQ